MISFYSKLHTATIKMGMIILVFLLVGCTDIGRSSSPTRYYVISPVDSIIGPAKSIGYRTEIAVGIGPILIPGYVDRQQIVTFQSPAKLKLSETDQWAEPLNQNIQRVLIDNISSIYGTEQVFSYPTDFKPDYETLQVTVEIIDLVQVVNGDVKLTATWNVKNLLDNDLVARTDGSYVRAAPVDDYEAIAIAVSELIALLSVDIAKTLKEIL